MLDVYVCEDNPKQLELFSKFVSDTILIEELDMQLTLSSTNPKEIFTKASESVNTGVFFLDIDLKSDMTGLLLAQELRKIQPRCYIIFITVHSEMGFMTFQYKIEALDFIVKDSPSAIQKRIHDCLLNVNEKNLALSSCQKETLVINQGDRRIPVDYDEVLFFETSETIHKVILHAKKRILEFNGQLKDIEEQLDYRFYRSHRSYIVNTDNIKEVDFQNAIICMVNGEICPISVRAKAGLKKLIL